MEHALTATMMSATIAHAIAFICSTVPDADIPAPLGEHEREEVTAEIDFTIPFAAESEGWHPDDRYAGRLHRLQEIKDLVLGGGSTGYAAMDRIVLEGVSKYHYTKPSNLQKPHHSLDCSTLG